MVSLIVGLFIIIVIFLGAFMAFRRIKKKLKEQMKQEQDIVMSELEKGNIFLPHDLTVIENLGELEKGTLFNHKIQDEIIDIKNSKEEKHEQ